MFKVSTCGGVYKKIKSRDKKAKKKKKNSLGFLSFTIETRIPTNEPK